MLQYKLSKNASLWLDIVRISAAQLVCIGHAAELTGLSTKLGTPKIFSLPSFSVCIFFILSGLLISYSVLGKQNYTFKEFFIDRFSRIYSALIPSLIFIAIADSINIYYSHIQIPFTYNIKTFIGNLFMLQSHPVVFSVKSFLLQNDDSLLNIKTFGTALPLWSLSIEWWLYLFFGWWLLSKNYHKRIYQVVLIFLSIVPAYYALANFKTEYGLTIIWFMGVVILLLLKSDLLKSINKINLRNFYLIFCVLFAGTWITDTTSSYLRILLAAAMMFFGVAYFDKTEYKPLGNISKKLIKYVADYSFTLYLIHYTIIIFFVNVIKMEPFQMLLLAVIVSNLFSFMLAYFTEMKHKQLNSFLKLKLNLNK